MPESREQYAARVREWIERTAEASEIELVTMDGFDDCIVGVCERASQAPFVLYDRAKVIARLRAEMSSDEDAEEYYEYNHNQADAWVGAGTPGFILLPPKR